MTYRDELVRPLRNPTLATNCGSRIPSCGPLTSPAVPERTAGRGPACRRSAWIDAVGNRLFFVRGVSFNTRLLPASGTHRCNPMHDRHLSTSRGATLALVRPAWNRTSCQPSESVVVWVAQPRCVFGARAVSKLRVMLLDSLSTRFNR